MKARIVRCDDHNVAVQVLREVECRKKTEDGKLTKTGETEVRWEDAGYYGHRLDHAAESALFLSLPHDVEVNAKLIKQAIASIVKETKEGTKEVKQQ